MADALGFEFGDGLFTSDPVPVEREVHGQVATFYMTALTGDDVAELAKQGVKLDEASLKKLNESQQATQSKRLLGRFLHGWDNLVDRRGEPVPYNEQNRDRFAVTEALATFIGIAKDLGVSRQEAEEKN